MRAKITPRKGRTVLIPGIDRQVPPEGMDVEWNSHWQRRFQEGDVDASIDGKPLTRLSDMPTEGAPAEATQKKPTKSEA